MLQKKVLSVKGGHDYIIAVSNGFFLLETCKLPALRRWLYVILSQSTCDHLIKGSLATAAYAIYSFGDWYCSWYSSAFGRRQLISSRYTFSRRLFGRHTSSKSVQKYFKTTCVYSHPIPFQTRLLTSWITPPVDKSQRKSEPLIAIAPQLQPRRSCPPSSSTPRDWSWSWICKDPGREGTTSSRSQRTGREAEKGERGSRGGRGDSQQGWWEAERDGKCCGEEW